MLPFRRSFLSSSMAVAAVLLIAFTDAFAPTTRQVSVQSFAPAPLNVFGKKEKEDLSYIESRDMTKEEMLELNKKNEDIMNMELQAMTGFSLILSLPILYLCWVAFFSD
ncbi:hypothetical protein IV203_001249 [Nitzschia inconspicua]|uniref:Transmembrane protein n=1 Tax=Nitzschia inconspicua TaxID=303405 RepID=A0A9K3PRF8_9STRA|nr:hypothetical protein IV203_001249 [Nitzschia inconspicua]